MKDREITIKQMKQWMLNNWGKRCPDFDEGCALCQAWNFFDYLTTDIDNPKLIEKVKKSARKL